MKDVWIGLEANFPYFLGFFFAVEMQTQVQHVNDYEFLFVIPLSTDIRLFFFFQPLEPLNQLSIFKIVLLNYLSGLSSNHNPSGLCLLGC
jgi:hypothetical protein